MMPKQLSDLPRTDVLSRVLDALRLSGAVVLHHCYAIPWSIRIPAAPELGQLLGADSRERVVAFHVAECDEFNIIGQDLHRTIATGEVAILFGGQAHTITRGSSARTVSLTDILEGHPPPDCSPGAGGLTKVLCGVFVLRDATSNPLFAALPSCIVAKLFEGPLRAVTGLLLSELGQAQEGGTFVAQRSLEILCAGAIRQYLATLPVDAVGLLSVLKDRRLASALERFVAAPGLPWSNEMLAKHAGLSPSRFAAVFVARAGEGPMAYMTRWRMNLAARFLCDSDVSVGEVAARVGYVSVPAFSRAFKRHLGQAPVHYRQLASRF